MALPVGVIEPFDWAGRNIPVDGAENPQMAHVDCAVMEAMREHGMVGCGMAITRRDRVIHSRAFGYSELPESPFLTSTSSRCASLSKPITALCALHLMSRGEYQLDEPALGIVSRIGIEPVPCDERVRHVMCRQLMDHTSGLSVSATYTAWRPDRNLTEILGRRVTSEDIAADALSLPLASDPGSMYQYANANFVILARTVAARSQIPFSEYLASQMLPAFGVAPSQIYVSRDQLSPSDSARGPNEAAYYQTSAERYGSFLPGQVADGAIYGEAYLGFSTECTDGGGGIAASAEGLATIIASLHSADCAISPDAMREIITPPDHRGPDAESFYSKGFAVIVDSDGTWFTHSGMTNHCGGRIGAANGYQFVAISNWNNVQPPYSDAILNQAISAALARL